MDVQMDVDTMVAKTLLTDMGLVGALQQQAGKGSLTADGLKQVAAATSSKAQPTATLPKAKALH
jgi:hypothetical protein